MEHSSAALGTTEIVSVGDGIDSLNAAWSFGGNTPLNFDNHVSKSVPKYNDGHDLVLALSDFFINKNSVVYELGSSTGALTRKLAQRHCSDARFIGIDIESAMTEQACSVHEMNGGGKNVSFVTDDILNFPYEKSDFIVAYYTIQFIPPRVRQQLFDHIYDSLNWGGAFVMFEKVRGPDARFQDIISSLYVDYKSSQGYAAQEILAKSRSLKGVLEPFSTGGNIDMLNRAGFVDVMSVFKHICFEGFFCIK
ncbi:methyltransferase domain-containing protein [Pantoea dispersa]|uniref:methyltransferase domain-containing protein n=1 Tax=Pantoea TaxID=53335 RepID=UPI0014196498|nr:MULTISPECIES: methyltransferase domain-containing protein [Pantoea]MBS0898117.1 methyltransferase domain-containing protein [Pantoea dispersa]MBS0907415.1 methyltransferase domain-containing protein [Pantoea dispersa]NIE52995.1 methyltransferase domain-containing protein [Pantoea sp. Ap-870]